VAEPSAADGGVKLGRIVGSGADALPMSRNWEGDELDRDLRLVRFNRKRVFNLNLSGN